MNTDAADYGGSGKGNAGVIVATEGAGGEVSGTMLLPPLATIMLECMPE
jgi:1,4-alpha-glucan branching enzyme